ncbi:hypothetical protein TWF281_011392 [Arthrobotrys megalospora]
MPPFSTSTLEYVWSNYVPILDGQEVERLKSMTEHSRQSSALRGIHNQAIRAHIKQVLPEVCGQAAKLKPEKNILSIVGFSGVFEMARRWHQELFELQLPRSFKLILEADAHLENLATIFLAINPNIKGTIEGPRASLTTNGGTIGAVATFGSRLISESDLRLLPVLFTHYSMAAARALAVTVVDAAEIAINFCRSKAILVELALLILVYDRMVWFGSKRITKAMAARAWIRALRSTPDIEAKIQRDLSTFKSDDWGSLLLGVVEKFKFDVDDEDGEPDVDAIGEPVS